MGPFTILIVDDEPANLETLGRLLSPVYLVRACESGEQAIEAAHRQPRPDLILLDIMMPGMDGYTVLSKFQEDEGTMDLPVIFVSAPGDDLAEEKAFRLGAADCITKPIKPAATLARVGMHLEIKQARDLLAREKDERKLTAERLAHLAAIVESSDDAIVSKTLEGNIVSWNEAAERIYGYTAEEIVGRHVSVLAPPEQADELSALLDRLKHGESITHRKMARRRKDGQSIHVSLSVSPIKDPEGRIVGASSIARDITDLERLEESLRATERKLSEVHKIAQLGHWTCDVRTGKVEWSEEVFKIFQLDPHSFAPQTDSILALSPWPEDYERDKELIRKAMESHERGTYEQRFLRPDNSIGYYESSFQGKYDEEGNLISIVGTVQDITERKRSEEALRESEDRYRHLCESIRDGFGSVDLNGRFLDANGVYLEMLGYSKEELLRLAYRDVTPERWHDYEADILGRQVLVRGYSDVYEKEYRRRDGSIFPVELRTCLMRDRSGQPAGYWAIVRDITERKRTEEALEKRIVALTQPLDSAQGVAFEDLFNLSDIQHLQDLYANAFGVAALMTKPDGTPITQPSNFTDFCSRIIRKTPKGLENCYRSDAEIGRYNPSGPNIRNCLSAGLCNAGASISVGGRHVANWLIGQVRNESQNEDGIMQYAREIGADETESLAAYRNVPVMPQEQFERVAHVLFAVANQLSTSAYQNVQQARFIAERKQAEDALREIGRLQSVILDNSTVGIALVRNRVFEWVNPRVTELHGIPKEQLQGASTRIVHVNDESYHELAAEAFPVLAQGKKAVIELEMARGDGSRFWCRLEGKALDASNPEDGVIWISEDITERKRAEQTLRESEERLRLALRATQDAVWDWNLSANTCYYSSGWWRMLGHEEKELTADLHLWRQLVPREDLEQIDRTIEEALIDKTSFEIEIPLLHKDGHYVPILVRAFILRDENGKPVRVVGTNTDLTERKRAREWRRQLEQQHLQIQKAESLNRMAGAVAHHFNNKLGVIMGNVELALHCIGSDSRLSAGLKDCLKATAEAAEVSAMMLAYLGQTPANLAPMDLAEVCREVLRAQAASIPASIALRTDIQPQSLATRGDPGKAAQVVANLITNAVEAIAETQGTIRVSLRIVQAGETTSSHRFPVDWNPEADRYACLEIADTGPGIPAEHLDSIFDPFFTTKFTGRGLGLAVVQGTVRLHGGAVAVESAPGQGTAFRVFWPLGAQEVYPIPQEKPALTTTLHESALILVVDDDAQLRDLIEIMLGDLGFRTVAAHDGFHALEIFRESRGDIGLVILDLTMPGMDGWQTLTELRALRRDLPVILASGYDETQVMQERHLERPQAFLKKPFGMNELKAALGIARTVQATIKEHVADLQVHDVDVTSPRQESGAGRPNVSMLAHGFRMMNPARTEGISPARSRGEPTARR